MTTAAHCDAVEHEPGAVVDETLALDDRHELARNAEATRDRGRRERVRRGDDRPEHERARPREVFDHRVCDDGHADGRHGDEAHRQQPDRPCGRSQVAKRGEEGRAVEERRQHAEEDELGLELELGHPRDDADRQAAEHEQDRIGDAQRRRDREHRRDGEDEPQRDDSVLNLEMHEPIVPKLTPSGSARSRPLGGPRSASSADEQEPTVSRPFELTCPGGPEELCPAGGHNQVETVI